MKTTNELNYIYTKTKNDFEYLLTNKERNQDLFVALIHHLTLNKQFNIYENNQFNIEEISRIFRFYEELLKESFNSDKSRFELEFKCYLLVIKIFTELCSIFTKDYKKRENIENFFQTLKESKNMLKLFLPLDMKHLNILNNLIGEQLYYFSHVNYHDISLYPLEYSFEKYHLNLEKIFHGFDLSKSSRFGNNEFTEINTEYAVLTNNASFLVLTLIHKIYFKNLSFDMSKSKFKSIINLYFENLNHNTLLKKHDIKSFESTLLEDFFTSGIFLKKKRNFNIFQDKLDLLRLNTDEYKQLIDIILKFDLQEQQ